ncbi:MAG: DUF1127 domain-containing protein, partial [Alphaproteobacteria bacterium]
ASEEQAMSYFEMKSWFDLWNLIPRWRQRISQRRELLGLNEHLLKDMGVRRLDAMHEASKPFWRS